MVRLLRKSILFLIPTRNLICYLLWIILIKILKTFDNDFCLIL
jgi:hypothetical protein